MELPLPLPLPQPLCSVPLLPLCSVPLLPLCSVRLPPPLLLLTAEVAQPAFPPRLCFACRSS